MSIYVIGIDPGSTGDRTGISIIRRERSACHLQTTTAKRGIKMAEIARSAIAIVRHLDESLPKGDKIAVVIDRGGIGLGPAEEIQRALKEAKKDGTLSRRVTFKAVHVVGGDNVTPDPDDPSRASVGRDLLYERGMQALREKTLIIANADGDAVSILKEELDGLVVTYSGARRTARTDHGKGKNDDVVFSLLLAFWLAKEFGGFGGITNAAQSVVAMATNLSARTPKAARRTIKKARPGPKPATPAPTWTSAQLMTVVRRHRLVIPGAVNLPADVLLASVNDALEAAGHPALTGSVAPSTKPSPVPLLL